MSFHEEPGPAGGRPWAMPADCNGTTLREGDEVCVYCRVEDVIPAWGGVVLRTIAPPPPGGAPAVFDMVSRYCRLDGPRAG